MRIQDNTTIIVRRLSEIYIFCYRDAKRRFFFQNYAQFTERNIYTN